MLENPRRLALSLLVKAEAQGSFSNIEISTAIKRSNMEKSDKALFTLLYMGVIEKKLYLDYVISKYSTKKIDELDLETKNILRLGIYQLLFCDRIPEYSAVDESVKLAGKKAKGFVNAVLRSFLRGQKKVELPKDEWEKISVVNSVPMEICKLFISSYGEKTAKEILEHTPKNYHLSLRINTLKTSEKEIEKELKKLGYVAEKSEIASDIILTDAPISDILELIDNGYIFVQDEASRIASCALGACEGELILDACACPGGKSFSIAIDMKNKGRIISCDLHRNKLSLISKGASRLGIDIIEAREQNGKEYTSELDLGFDRVLCDVPCSGLGVIFKKPEIKYKSQQNIEALPSVQLDIITNCAKYVKKGGILVYSTCTLNKEENEENVKRFLSKNKDFSLSEFYVGNTKIEGGVYTFLPHINGTDGFFVAKMVRNEK